MAYETIRYTVEYVNEKYKDRKIVFSVTTNGYLLNQDMLNFFKRNDICLALSIDGGKIIQNKQRALNNGEDAFAKIMSQILMMKQTGLPIFARATYYDFEIDLARIYNELLLMGVDEIHIVPDFSHIKDYDEVRKLKKQVESLYKYCKYYMENILYNVEKFPFVTIAQAIRMLYFAPFSYTYSCEKGKTLIAIDCRGDVYPCHRLSSVTGNRIGNINNFKEEKVLTQSDCEAGNEKCKRCWNRYTCSHGCGHNHSKVEEFAFCEYAKKVTEISIALVAEMDVDTTAKAIRL